jgi:hypothetical protein
MTGPPDPLPNLRSALKELQGQREDADALARAAQRRSDELTNVIDRLTEIIDQLADSAHDADRAFAAMDRLRGEIPMSPHIGSAPPEPFGASGPRPSAREAVLQLLRSEDRVFEASEIVTRVQEMGSTADPRTTRSLLSKMASSNEVERPARGLYRAVRARPNAHFSRQKELSDESFEAWVAEEAARERARPDDEHDELENEPSDEEYAEMDRDAQQASLEDQADREETP